MKSLYYTLLISAFFMTSCKDKNPVVDCGCNSPTVKVLENVKASYVRSNNLLIRLRSPDDVPYEELYQLCSQTDTLSVTPDIKNPDYIVSGKVKTRCSITETLIMVPSLLFEITEIKKAL